MIQVMWSGLGYNIRKGHVRGTYFAEGYMGAGSFEQTPKGAEIESWLLTFDRLVVER